MVCSWGSANPLLPLQLWPQFGNLPHLARAERRLLGLRVALGATQDTSTGQAFDADRARIGGIELGSLGQSGRGFGDLLPSQWALPEETLLMRQLRGELLFRSQDVSEPPRL